MSLIKSETGMNYQHLKGNKHGQKSEYPRKTSWGNARAAAEVVSLAKKRAQALDLTLADYIEALVLDDIKTS